MTRRTELRDDDAGLGLIELIVAMLISSLIFGVIVMIFVNSWRTQEEVTTVTQATNRGQLVASTIERAMRNALYFEVDDTGTELRVRTSLSGALACQGFQLTAGSARMATSTSTTPLPVSASSWPLWQTGIAQRTGVLFFQTTGDVVTYTFDVTTEAAPVRFKGEAVARSLSLGGSGSCW